MARITVPDLSPAARKSIEEAIDAPADVPIGLKALGTSELPDAAAYPAGIVFDTSAGKPKYSDGSGWNLFGPATAASLSFAPAGTVAATNVQAAIVEVDGEKVAKAGDTMTGGLAGTTLTMSGKAAFGAGLQTNTEVFVTASRTTNTDGFLVIRAGKSASNGGALALQRTATAQQCLLSFETNSSSAPDGYFGSCSGFTGRIYALGGNGSGGAIAVDPTQGLMVGSGIFSAAAATIGPNGDIATTGGITTARSTTGVDLALLRNSVDDISLRAWTASGALTFWITNVAQSSYKTFNLNAATVTFPVISTTASAANAFLNSAAGNSLLRSTSSLRYKTEVATMGDGEADRVLALRPVTYRSRAKADDPSRTHYGFIAEEADALGLMALVNYDEEMRPDGFQYERVIPALVSIIKRLEARVSSLEGLF